MICEAGDVAVVPFPFTDMAVSKHRPAVVISNNEFNAQNGSTILVMITTARASSWPSDLPLRDPARAGLKQDCYVRWKVFSLPNDLIRRTAGRLGELDRAAVQGALHSHLF